MTPKCLVRLLSLDGTTQGQTFEPQGEECRIGRHPENELQLRRMGISRFHCRLYRQDDGWWLEDSGSKAGTTINRRPIVDRGLLGTGDVIHIGEASLLFLADDPEVDADEGTRSSITWASRNWGGSTQALQTHRRFRDYFDSAFDGAESLTAQLRTLLDLATELPEESRPEAVAEKVLERIAQCMPLDRSAVLWRELGAPWRPLGIWPPTAGEVLEVDPEWLDTAARDGATRFEAAPSCDGSSTARDTIIVPLYRGDSVVGALYLEENNAGAPAEHHSRWLDAVGRLLAPTLVNARRQQRLQEKNQGLTGSTDDFEMIGRSRAMGKIFQLITKVAPTPSTVLVRGESGTGKELVAGALHGHSRRADGPFVAINCATLSATLLESELFGHERGAFTGAVARRQGKVEAADGGTLFLDEVGEIPLELQARLLRVLQEKTIERVGGNRPIQVDVRWVAATNRDLEKAVAEGTFREDLFYRLNVISVRLPPLRERRSDILPLADYFTEKHGRSMGRIDLRLSDEARRSLERYDWPGNVRELSNAVERGVVLAEGSWIELEDLPEALVETRRDGPDDSGATPEGYHAAVTEAKKRILQQALEAADGNFVTAAERLGLRRTYLHRLVSNLGLRS